ncbi:acetyl-CoA hydrolase/transferase C-terminal domain-containing protein [Chelatococcus asaccharovorans]|nr:acetyl-CoA hydrolase/transferase C-terminal domain-containing protein [Chelatococcus asaccharovorans]MBS7705482.1 hypothetical protein [Chelatococcus asaccharovorans]
MHIIFTTIFTKVISRHPSDPGLPMIFQAATESELITVAGRLLAGRREVRVLSAMSPQQPTELIGALIDVALERDVRITLFVADLDGLYGFLDPGHRGAVERGQLRLVALAGGIPAVWHAHIDHFPIGFWDIDQGLATGNIPIDLVIAEMTGDPNDGSFGFGAMVGYTASALASGASAAAILRPETARFANAPRVPRDRFDALITAPPQHPTATVVAPPSAIQMRIAAHVAELVPDGATLQLGIGAMAQALAGSLDGKSDLGVHSGIISGALARLVRSGTLSGRRKSADQGLIVATGVIGLQSDEAEDLAERVALRPVSETHDARSLARQDRLWALNSCLEIDLSCRINAEYISGRRVSSGGGQSDFARAAHLSRGGASVIMLPSATAKGQSRIVPSLAAGQRETTAPQDVDFVVTENGSADLRGCTAAERREKLIAIAHPDHRDALRSQHICAASG